MTAPGSKPPMRPPTAAGDTWGGLAAMLVALPSSIAYGVAIYGPLGGEYTAHGVRAGLVGAIALALVTAAVGGAPRLISAPCAPAAAVLAALVSQTLGHDPEPGGASRIVVLLTLVAIFSAGLQLAYGFAGGGRLIKYIPYPVVSGYLSAVGVIIFLGQLPKFLGLAHGASPLHAAAWQVPAIVTGTATIAGVLLAPRLTRAVPAPIIGLVAGLLAYFAQAAVQPGLLQTAHNPLVIGPVGGGLALFSGLADPWLALGALHLRELSGLLVPALTLSVLLSVDTLKTCVVVDALARGRHDSNRTLLAQGAGNLASVFLGGMPGSGTMGATLVNVESGGHSRRSGLTEGLLMLATALVLGGAIAWVPVAALAGILLVVAVRMFDWGSLQLLRQRETRLDFAVIATVVVVAVAVNLIAAAGAGVGLAILLFLREQIHGSVIRRTLPGSRLASTQYRLPEELAVLEKAGAQTLVCELQGSLFFGTTDQLLTELEPAVAGCRFLILDLRRVQSVDFTAAHLLERFEANLKERDGWLLLSRVPAHLPTGRNLQDYFAKVGVVATRHQVKLCETLDDALMWVEDRLLQEALPQRAGDTASLALADFHLVQDVADPASLAALAACAEPRTYQAGEVIFQSGDAGRALYLVRRGVVRIVLPLERGGYHNLAAFARGNFFGEMSFLSGGGRAARAMATTDVDLFVIEREAFEALWRAHPALGAMVFRRIARELAVRLRRANTGLRALYDA